MENIAILKAPALGSAKKESVKNFSRNWTRVSGKKLAIRGMIALNLLLLASYLQGINSYSSTGYEIKKLQSRLTVLTEQNKQLSVKAAELSSMAGLQNDFSSLGYVPAGTPHFLSGEHSQYSFYK